MTREIELATRQFGGNRFALVTLVTLRTKELQRGSPPQAHSAVMKPCSIAIAEAAAGKVTARH